jgi:hypothetical protein
MKNSKKKLYRLSDAVELGRESHLADTKKCKGVVSTFSCRAVEEAMFILSDFEYYMHPKMRNLLDDFFDDWKNNDCKVPMIDDCELLYDISSAEVQGCRYMWLCFLELYLLDNPDLNVLIEKEGD